MERCRARGSGVDACVSRFLSQNFSIFFFSWEWEAVLFNGTNLVQGVVFSTTPLIVVAPTPNLAPRTGANSRIRKHSEVNGLEGGKRQIVCWTAGVRREAYKKPSKARARRCGTLDLYR